MARSQDFKYGEDTGYVDIHGRDVRVIICEKTGLILVPIDELKNMGFSIYRKSQYNKLLIDDSQFTNEFNLYMLECAQTYMLKNKIAFKENEILESINKCKKLLAEGHAKTEGHVIEPKKESSTAPQFLKNHTVMQNSDANISISSLREPSAVTMQNLNLHDNRSKSFAKPLNVSNNPESDQYRRQSDENKNQRSSRPFDQNSNHNEYQKKQNNAFEYKNPRGPRSFDQSSFTSENSDENRRQSNSFDNRKPRQSDSFDNRKPRQSDSFDNRRPRQSDSFDNRKPRQSDSFNQNGRIRNNYDNESQDKFKNQQKRDNDLQEDDMKKIPSIEFTKPVHKVLVTFVEKPNVLWVQDVENADTLVKIDNMIKTEVFKNKIVSRAEFNNIFLGKDEGEWYRCKPIRFKPLTVFFIDYGNTAQVTATDLREVSEELASFPAQAVRVTFDEPEKHKIEAFNSITIQIVKRFDRGTYRVEIVPEDDAKEDIPPTPQPTPQPPTVEKKATPTYFDRPKPLHTLQDGQRVMVVNEIDGKLVLRTKECYDKLKQVEQQIEGVADEPLPDKAKKGQLVLCNHNDKLQRGQVVAITGDSVEVKLLDYGDKITVNMSSLKNMTESLSVEPVTYIISPSINGGKELSEEAKKLIRDMIKNRTKCTVVLKEGDFDLKLTDGLLSEKIGSIEGESDRIMLRDLQWYEPRLGQGIYMLYSFKDSDNVTLVAGDELAKHIDEVIIAQLEDDQPHTPIVGEVCYGFCQENWSRCVIIREMKGRFEVKFIDFGNLEFLKAEHLRKATDDIKNVPVLGVQSRFVGLPPLKNIEQLLNDSVADGEEYMLDIKKFDSDSCEIEAPELYKQLRESH